MNTKIFITAVIIFITTGSIINPYLNAETRGDEWTADDELLMASLDQNGLSDGNKMKKILDAIDMEYASKIFLNKLQKIVICDIINL